VNSNLGGLSNFIQSLLLYTTTLIATLNTQLLGKNFETIISSLTDRYEIHLRNGSFSLNKFKWTEFNQADLTMINSVLGINTTDRSII
jgi:hypothetical protein